MSRLRASAGVVNRRGAESAGTLQKDYAMNIDVIRDNSRAGDGLTIVNTQHLDG